MSYKKRCKPLSLLLLTKDSKKEIKVTIVGIITLLFAMESLFVGYWDLSKKSTYLQLLLEVIWVVGNTSLLALALVVDQGDPEARLPAWWQLKTKPASEIWLLALTALLTVEPLLFVIFLKGMPIEGPTVAISTALLFLLYLVNSEVRKREIRNQSLKAIYINKRDALRVAK